LAETFWSAADKKNWNWFARKTEAHMERYDIAEKKYATSMFDPIITTTKASDGRLQVQFDSEINDLQLYYSFDNTFPDNFYPAYKGGALYPPSECSMMRVVAYRGKQKMGNMITITREELEKRANKKAE
jgi:hexosaminidase